MWPLFGRDVPEAAWRATAELINHSCRGRIFRATGERDLDSVHRHAAVEPAWLWGAAAAAPRLSWQRPRQSVLDPTGAPEWTRWWPGDRSNRPAAATDPRAASRPDEPARVWESEDGAVR